MYLIKQKIQSEIGNNYKLMIRDSVRSKQFVSDFKSKLDTVFQYYECESFNCSSYLEHLRDPNNIFNTLVPLNFILPRVTKENLKANVYEHGFEDTFQSVVKTLDQNPFWFFDFLVEKTKLPFDFN